MSTIPPIQTDPDALPVVALTGSRGESDKGAQVTGELKYNDGHFYGSHGDDTASSDGSALESNDAHSSKNNPFADPVVAARWRGVYENARYEARHVFDENLTWSADEERRLVRKLDWHVCLWAVCSMIIL